MLKRDYSLNGDDNRWNCNYFSHESICWNLPKRWIVFIPTWFNTFSKLTFSIHCLRVHSFACVSNGLIAIRSRKAEKICLWMLRRISSSYRISLYINRGRIIKSVFQRKQRSTAWHKLKCMLASFRLLLESNMPLEHTAKLNGWFKQIRALMRARVPVRPTTNSFIQFH